MSTFGCCCPRPAVFASLDMPTSHPPSSTHFPNTHPVPLLCLRTTRSEDLEVVLEFVYGYLPPADHDFDPASGTYIPTAAPKKGPGLVRRSLSFGKKKRAAEKPKRRPAAVLEAEAMEAAEAIPELDTEVRMLSIAKNDEGRICVTFKIHEVTGELMIGLVGEGSPAALAGVEVGDRVLALGSKAAGCEV